MAKVKTTTYAVAGAGVAGVIVIVALLAKKAAAAVPTPPTPRSALAEQSLQNISARQRERTAYQTVRTSSDVSKRLIVLTEDLAANIARAEVYRRIGDGLREKGAKRNAGVNKNVIFSILGKTSVAARTTIARGESYAVKYYLTPTIITISWAHMPMSGPWLKI